MADELSEEEVALLKKHRAEKAKSGRKVTVKGKHTESGADYEFTLEGDEADRVVARHSSLFEEADDDSESSSAGGSRRKPAADGKTGTHPYFKGNKE